MKIVIKNEHWLPLGLLSIVYCLLSFLNLINWGIYWDDWWLVSLSDSDMHKMFYQAGNPIIAYLHLLFRASPFPLVSYRVAQFLCGYITMIAVYLIMLKVIIQNKYWAFWGAVFFVALPLNFAKITLICFPYIICLTFFYFSFALMLFKKDRLISRLLAQLLFFLSFMTNSLVAFYFVFLIVLYMQWTMKSKDFLNFKKIFAFLRRNWDFVLLPVVFVAFKYLLLPVPSGDYAGYNSLHFSFRIVGEILKAFHVILTRVVPKSFSLIIAGGLIVFYPIVLRNKLYKNLSSHFSVSRDGFLKTLFVSVVSVFTAILPYLLVKTPGFIFGTEWADRDTMLLPLGISLFFISIIIFVLSFEYLKNNAVSKFILGFVLPLVLFFSFSLSTIKGQVQLFKDAIKQDAILNFMRNEPGFYKNYTFVFIDKCMDSNIFARIYRSYEPNGMAQSIFGDQKRYFVSYGSSDLGYPSCLKSVYPSINGICKDWRKSDVFKHFSIECNPQMELNSCKIIKLSFFKFFKKEHYHEELSKYFLLTLR